MNENNLWVLTSAASIIQLRLNTEDRARISIILFLAICMILPRILLARILRKMAVFIMNMRI
jgi:hypothetical protein